MTVGSFIIALLVMLGGFAWQTSLGGINRKIAGRFQKRYGPKWYQEFRDIFKALTKSAITHGWIFDFGVLMAVGGIMATAMFTPVANIIAFPGRDNFFIFVYLFAVGMLGMAMSSVGSGNPLAGIGVMRALTTMVGYEVPFMVLIFSLIYRHGTSSISELVLIQQNAGLWNIVALPLGGIVGFICLLGMIGKKPFETYIAPAELASGPMVEYGGKQLGMLFIMHELSVFIEVSLFVNIFLGGGSMSSPLGILEFAAKYFVVYALANLISNALGRFKIDQVIQYYYKVPIILAFIQALLIIHFGWGV